MNNTDNIKELFDDKGCIESTYNISYDELVNSLFYANHKDEIDEINKRFRELADEWWGDNTMSIVLNGICPKCKFNFTNWFNGKCANCGYIGLPINDE